MKYLFISIIFAFGFVGYIMFSPNKKLAKNIPYNVKPKAPVTISTDISGEVNADTEYTINLSFIPLKDCSVMKTTIVGLDGVVVHNGDTKVLDNCLRNNIYTQTIYAEAPANIAGYISVRVEMQINGKTIVAVKAFPFKAKGATFSHKPMGKIKTDSEGNKLIIQKAEER